MFTVNVVDVSEVVILFTSYAVPVPEKASPVASIKSASAGGSMVTVAELVIPTYPTCVAVIVALVTAVTVAGAVYTPPVVIVPGPDTLQVTATGFPAESAEVKVTVPPPSTIAEGGVTTSVVKRIHPANANPIIPRIKLTKRIFFDI
jgi:hypothetical protein